MVGAAARVPTRAVVACTTCLYLYGSRAAAARAGRTMCVRGARTFSDLEVFKPEGGSGWDGTNLSPVSWVIMCDRLCAWPWVILQSSSSYLNQSSMYNENQGQGPHQRLKQSLETKSLLSRLYTLRLYSRAELYRTTVSGERRGGAGGGIGALGADRTGAGGCGAGGQAPNTLREAALQRD